jgi:dATP/dGTP diphosphohydrolase
MPANRIFMPFTYEEYPLHSSINDRLTQVCGCDPGANWVCEIHRAEQAQKLLNLTFPPTIRTATTEAQIRKQHPVATGVLDYFPDAIKAIALVSFVGNEQHNPGSPLHWDRTKSKDEADALIRHFLDRGTLDSDGIRHSAKMAWRALALLQKEIEQEKA